MSQSSLFDRIGQVAKFSKPWLLINQFVNYLRIDFCKKKSMFFLEIKQIKHNKDKKLQNLCKDFYA